MTLKRSACVFGMLFIAGCYGPGPDGKPVIVVDLGSSPCADVRQVANSSEATLKVAKEAEVSGKITPTKLVDIQQKMFLLQSQSDTTCQLFNRGRINFDQYRSEMDRITTAMFKLKDEVEPAK